MPAAPVKKAEPAEPVKRAEPAEPKAAVKAEEKHNDCRSGTPVHLMDIHMEKGMHCVDCHFSQDMHGNNRLHAEVRAATEIACIDCHEPSTMQLRVTRPGFIEGIRAFKERRPPVFRGE